MITTMFARAWAAIASLTFGVGRAAVASAPAIPKARNTEATRAGRIAPPYVDGLVPTLTAVGAVPAATGQGRRLLIEEPTFKAIRTPHYIYSEHRSGEEELYGLGVFLEAEDEYW
jgi:hypothetical protein